MKTRQLNWIALAGLIAACDSPLDTEPTASIEAGTALTSARGIGLAMNGAYRQLQSSSLYGRQELAYSDMYADNLNFNGTFGTDREVSIRQILPSNGGTGDIWTASYIGINRANYILDALPNVSDLTDPQKAQYRGEVLWIRSVMYALLVKYFDGVPLVEVPSKGVDESLYKPRSTRAETYALIVRDLEEAATLLAAAKSNGRATQGAANAILARMYLEMGQYAQARDKATSVISNPAYQLVPNLREFFTNKNGPESIYEVQFTVANANSAAFWFFPPSVGGRLGFAPSPGLLNAYEAGDTRRAASIATAGAQVYGFKYYRIATGDDNIPVARLAEQYLIRAEANARLNAPAATVHADINVIRNRSGLANLSAAVTTQQALLDAILQERRVELAFEGFRFMDLRRYGIAEAVLGITAARLLWPIPQFELDVNERLTQNPGY